MITKDKFSRHLKAAEVLGAKPVTEAEVLPTTSFGDEFTKIISNTSVPTLFVGGTSAVGVAIHQKDPGTGKTVVVWIAEDQFDRLMRDLKSRRRGV